MVKMTERAVLPGFMIIPFVVSWYEHETQAQCRALTGLTINYKL